jgi:hypothetical protein
MIISSYSIYFLELDNFMIGKREWRGELAKKNSCYFPNIEERKRLPKKATAASQT